MKSLKQILHENLLVFEETREDVIDIFNDPKAEVLVNWLNDFYEREEYGLGHISLVKDDDYEIPYYHVNMGNEEGIFYVVDIKEIETLWEELTYSKDHYYEFQKGNYSIVTDII